MNIYECRLTLFQLEENSVGAVELLIGSVEDEAGVHVLQGLLGGT